MYNGKFNHRRRLVWRREFVLMCSIMVLVLGMVGGSLAYLLDQSGSVENTFVAPEIDVTIPEDFDDGDTIKKDVKIQNLCEFDVFARATWVAYWEHEDTKEVYSTVPNVTVVYNIRDWYEGEGGYWYCKKILAENEESPVFIVSAQLADGETAPADGYRLVIDVIGEVVQSKPERAVIDVWGYTPSAS